MTYLDNAATTYHKPEAVYRAMSQSFGNPGRGGHALSLQAGEIIFECRDRLARFFGAADPTQIIFTNNTTGALNIAIKGSVRTDDHVIISGMEHNSVVRPVYSVTKDISVAEADKYGIISPETIAALIRPNTRLVIITHASNICGSINNIKEIGKITRENNILFLVDAAQTAGVIDINVEDMNIDMLAFAGHKMLYGPQGTGGLYVRDHEELTPLIEGGTGSMSDSFHHPNFMPDKFESGTANTPGIAGLNEGLKFIEKITLEEIRAHENELTKELLDGLQNIKNVAIFGTNDLTERVGVVGFKIKKFLRHSTRKNTNIPLGDSEDSFRRNAILNQKDNDSVEMCTELNEKYNIAARGGLHCAGLAHRSLGTPDTGLIRFSVSYFTKKRDIQKALHAVLKLSQQ